MSRAKSLPRHEVGSDFVSHLEELRRRLLICLVAFSLSAVLFFFFSKGILDFLIQPLRRSGQGLLFFQKPYEAFFVHVKVAALAGLMASSPLIFAQAWLFTSPGLYAREKETLLPLIVVSAALFLAGGAFAYFFMVPWGLSFLLSYQTDNLRPLLGVSAYFSFLSGMVLGCGLVFDLPVVLVGLVKLGVVRSRALEKSRRAVIVFIFILAAVITPSPDPISQILLAVPLWLFFEISLLLARQMERL